MPDTSRLIILVISVFTGCVCVALVFLLSLVGGLLNRGRGGYIHFGPANSSSPEGQVWYWPAHILSRLLFAVPTGIVVVGRLASLLLCKVARCKTRQTRLVVLHQVLVQFACGCKCKTLQSFLRKPDEELLGDIKIQNRSEAAESKEMWVLMQNCMYIVLHLKPRQS